MKKIILIIIAITTLTSCVSKKVYEELEGKYSKLKSRNQNLVGENDDLFSTTKDLENANKKLQKSVDSLGTAKTVLLDDVVALESKKKQLEALYEELSKSSASDLNAKAQEILELSKKLNAKETALISENLRLEKLKGALATGTERITQLETLMAAKEAKMQQLKNAISMALKGFEGKGLTVHQKNGKVYVSMENKLLFSSGSWLVGSQGKRAVVELSKVLAKNKDIEVLIEGHTDNVPYKGNSSISDNWDLSTKRATAIVRILTQNQVKPSRITAAGRGKYVPISSNTTTTGKAKNRRIEVILTPNLDAINNLLAE